MLELRPDLGSLVEEARELHERVAATSGPAGAWAMSLTGAELRLLPYLATHLTFPEIASQAVHLAQHRQDRSGLDLPQAGRFLAQPGDRARRRGRAPGELALPAAGKSHPVSMTREARLQRSNTCRPQMDDYKEHLRRLAVHDDAFSQLLAW